MERSIARQRRIGLAFPLRQAAKGRGLRDAHQTPHTSPHLLLSAIEPRQLFSRYHNSLRCRLLLIASAIRASNIPRTHLPTRFRPFACASFPPPSPQDYLADLLLRLHPTSSPIYPSLRSAPRPPLTLQPLTCASHPRHHHRTTLLTCCCAYSPSTLPFAQPHAQQSHPHLPASVIFTGVPC